MATVTGYIEKIKYRNPENGYTVLEVSSSGEDFVLVGSFNYIDEGTYIRATGNMELHPVYGEQLYVNEYDISTPEDEVGVERYLSSGAIKGVGVALAKRIIKKFKADTLRIIEEEPERLSEIKGISERMAMNISSQISEKKEMRDAMIYLQRLGIRMSLAVKIYKEYGQDLYKIIKDNPYQLADDISGIGFKVADEIAIKAGVRENSEFRIKGAICYALTKATTYGHMYLPKEILLQNASELLGIEKSQIEDKLSDMQMEKRIVIKESAKPLDNTEERTIIYLIKNYFTELNTARLLHDLDVKATVDEAKVINKIKKIEKEQSIELDDMQRGAVLEAVKNGLLVITGGPGTGKTTTINTIIRYFREQDKEILLAAPTGRAAKRMTEATACEAKTIHRLLEITGGITEDNPDDASDHIESMHFTRNEEYPLEADVIIVDEVSMVDIYLMLALLKAVSVGTRLILVGDVNQLPSVGPGNVLRDIIDSGAYSVVRLEQIYRQAMDSDIIVNAHKMISREQIDLTKRSNDFLLVKRDSPNEIIAAMLTLISKKLPKYVHTDSSQIQVLTPMRKGELGVDRLNIILQDELNPVIHEEDETRISNVRYRIGDKVMQIKNNYHIAWEIRNRIGEAIQRGEGVYNGDIGIIRELNDFAQIMTVEYDEGRLVEYDYSETDQLELAYAITIHKSQGSEYPAIIIPLYDGPRKLLTRNLIYTAVTRAKSCVVLIGNPNCFYRMMDNTIELKRYSGLKERIDELR